MTLREWADRQIVSERELTDALEGRRPLSCVVRTITRATNSSHAIVVPNGREWEIISLTMIGAAAGAHRINLSVRDEAGIEIFYVQSNEAQTADVTNVSPNGENYQRLDGGVATDYIGFKLPFDRLLSNWTLNLSYIGAGTGILEGVIKEHW